MATTPPKPASLRLNIQTCVQRIQPKLMPVIRHLTRRISKMNCLLSDHETSQRKTVKKTRRAQGKCFFQWVHFYESIFCPFSPILLVLLSGEIDPLELYSLLNTGEVESWEAECSWVYIIDNYFPNISSPQQASACYSGPDPSNGLFVRTELVQTGLLGGEGQGGTSPPLHLELSSDILRPGLYSPQPQLRQPQSARPHVK